MLRSIANRPIKEYTLVLPRDKNRVLLGYKKRGFGVHKWNGFGGKIESGETILEGAKRELREECGIRCENWRYAGRNYFEFVGQDLIMLVHIFDASGIRGEESESEEMCPQWFDLAAPPYDDMWADDRVWWQWLLRGEPFEGHFLFPANENRVLEYELRALEQQNIPAIS